MVRFVKIGGEECKAAALNPVAFVAAARDAVAPAAWSDANFAAIAGTVAILSHASGS